jgi:hypothetical protein
MSPRLVESPAPPKRWATSKILRQRFGDRGRLWLPRAIKSKGFPKPFRLGGGRLYYWDLAEVEAWEAAQAERVA